MSLKSGDAAIVGAGIIGLAIAFELAQRGATVRVFDRAEPARAASWAAAGMLAPESEAVADPSLMELCRNSLRRYPDFVERVREASGVDPRLRLDGILHAAFDTAHAQALRARDGEFLEREALLEREPWIGPSVTGALLVRGEGHVDNRRLGRALVAACERLGVMVARAEWARVECDGRRVLGVRSDLGFTGAQTVVNACGCWAGQLEGVPQEALPNVEPVKGQMLALSVPAGLIRHATWVPGAYLVPRDDGRLLIGATSERAGFDARVTAAGIDGLLHAALAAAPSLGAFTVSETWAGLRPATPDGRPVIGPTPIAGLLNATGHYRNGILLAPVTASLIADCVEYSLA